jgi:hypothetical protein
MLVYHIKYINEMCGVKYQSCLMLHQVALVVLCELYPVYTEIPVLNKAMNEKTQILKSYFN